MKRSNVVILLVLLAAFAVLPLVLKSYRTYLVTLFCGLFPSSPNGEKPVIVMKLNPRSRARGEIAGKPTSEFKMLAS